LFNVYLRFLAVLTHVHKLRERVAALASALRYRFGIGEDDVGEIDRYHTIRVWNLTKISPTFRS